MPKPKASPQEPIAVVGSGCRFPGGANSPSALWKLLEKPRDLSREIPSDRFTTAGFYHQDGQRHGATNVRHSYLLDEDVRLFDAAFFNISNNEAEAIDPQQRLLLETVYEALEAGGHALEALRGSDTSVYVGTMTVDYHDQLLRDHNAIPKYFATGINRAIISNRVSYFFDWHGPSMTIDTACSSSLIAVHQGVQSLRSGESQVSVACGTQVLLGYDMYIGESKLKMLSPNGRSRMWDADADGYARGEGVAAIVMKRLGDAVADGDHIECVIRETGGNQDGFSSGLTVPSSEAQAALMRSTYAKAGLDPEHNPYDRPQYFEAHGTGTQAGDPREAAAIHDVFGKYGDSPSGSPLYVGSIKTIVGHLEGAAGLAGFLKASNTLQRGMIPPNLHFNKLNPKIEPFYQGLQVPKSLIPWPELPEGVPRRVSVNSFGFGGANAHAIIEEYLPRRRVRSQDVGDKPSTAFAPFVFSANTESSLVALLERYSDILKDRADSINVSDLAWTLHSRRSQFPTRVTFPASNLQKLSENIKDKLASAKKNPGTAIGTRTSGKPGEPRILGVFTGQGAQWPAMGAQLICPSSFVSKRIQELEDSLASLPQADRPGWSLRKEMLAGADTSRIAEAALSQPLCTALQIVLVDLLKTAGITFAAVVGHSSGEIGAAYAAGFISAEDAIRVAYYRGLYAKLAGNHNNGQKGAMLAVGTSWEEAQELVNQEAFKGRIATAAHNSSASVTLSGDADAIAEAKKYCDDKNIFARPLKVDTAYHSHHMQSCGETYVQALRGCGVKVNSDRDTACKWLSSVTSENKSMEAVPELRDEYWRDNMTSAVLFAEAVKNAVSSDEHLNLVTEVGPHPALKGPATQSIADLRSTPIPYTGVLSRGNDDVATFSDALGFVWTHLGFRAVNLKKFENAATGRSREHRLITDLPSYQWDHPKAHWSESRRSKKVRGRDKNPHELLGIPSPESNSHDMRWQNILKVSEIPWLEGHQLQGLVVFPASGYVAMAIEACRELAGDSTVELFELHNLTIPRAITFEEGDTSGAETLATLTAIQHHADETVTADFAIYSTANVSTGSDSDMDLVASGRVKVLLGRPDLAALPCNVVVEDYNMTEVEPDRVYNAFSKLGYGYTGPFRGLTSIKRKLNQASALVDTYAYSDDDATFYLVHPAMLDVAIQSSMLAYSSPGDERLWSLHVPTNIRTIRVNPEVCAALSTTGSKVPIATTLDGRPDSFAASIDIYSEDSRQGMIQVEDLILKPFAPATEAEDRWMYSSTKLDVAAPDAAALVDFSTDRPTTEELDLATALERISYYYLRKWRSDISDKEWAEAPQQHFVHLGDFVEHTLSRASSGKHATLRRKWANDTADDVASLISRYSDDVTVRLLQAVGEKIPTAVRGQTNILEHMKTDNMLADHYTQGIGFAKHQSYLASLLKQITHRYPKANILEIGAGTGGATKVIMEAIASRGGALPCYTYTDCSEETLKKASGSFGEYGDKMTFKILDIEQSPSGQDYEPQSYDIVVASNIMHTTTSIQRALEHTRQLLKPGGYLALLEPTDNDPVRFTTIMGGLPDWWRGVQDGRKYNPTIAPGTWHSALRKAGFGGIDTITPKPSSAGSAWPFSVMAAQAVDPQISFLRRPLSSPSGTIFIDSLVILGTDNLETYRIAEEIADSLGRFCGSITVLSSLPTEEEAEALDQGSTFINLADLESPIFNAMTNETMDGLKRVFGLARHILWITCGAASGEEPYHAASLAFCRSLSNEAQHISFSTIDVSVIDHTVPKVISERVLRLYALEEWDQQRFLWSQEPEMYLHQGKTLIPRILPNLDQNARLNATRREIIKTVPASTANLAIVADPAAAVPTIVEDVVALNSDEQQDLMKAEATSLMAMHIAPNTFLFLAIGKSVNSGRNEVVLSATNSSSVAPVVSVPLPEEHGDAFDADRTLVAITSELLASSLLDDLAPGSSVLIHCSEHDRVPAAALMRRAGAKNIRVTFSCDATGEGDHNQGLDASWIKLNAREPRLALRKKLLSVEPTHFLDLTAPSPTEPLATSDMGLNIEQMLPSDCTNIDLSRLSQHQAIVPPSLDEQALVARLQDAVSGVKPSMPAATIAREQQVEESILHLDQAQDESALHHTTSVVHWPEEGEVKVEARPISDRVVFSKDKTYVLFGLSGQVGQSLCEWMVANGAGCVVLTSRNPKVDQRWIDSFEASKASVEILAADITDKDSLDGVLKTIRETCPPIAGIANGANVLNDAPFDGMSSEMMASALGPKIDGSYNLDQAFYDDDLEFFILFSSISAVIGTAGQSNYVAANGYLNGLARQRRSRGLAASAFDIGLILGIGVAEAAGQGVVDSLQKYGITPLSEPDLRLAFAESIEAGRATEKDQEPGALPGGVMTSGLRAITTDEDNMVWYNNPIFSHLVFDSKNEEGGDQSKSKTLSIPVTEQIAAAADQAEALQVLKDAFSTKLGVVLQSTDQAISHDTPLVELGIDSLIAVEVRSWVLKVLKVDIPVLKLVGGSNLADICELVIKKLPDDLLAKIGAGSATPEDSKPATQPSKAQLPPLTKPQSITPTSSSEDDRSTSGLRTPATADTPVSSVAPSMFAQKDDAGFSSKSRMGSESKTTSQQFVRSEPISIGQSRFWFLRLLVEDPTTFNVALSFRMNGNVRVGDLERAIRVVTARHESLRTSFVGDGDEADQASQKVSSRSTIKLERKAISSTEEVAVEYEQLRNHQFNLKTGPLMRLMLLTQSPTSHYLLVNYHHIIMDMASFQVFTQEIENIYNGVSLGPPPRQYPDFSVAQRQALEQGELSEELAYWKSVFPPGDQPPILPLLPMAKSRSRVAMSDYAVHQVSTRLDPDLAGRVKAVSKGQRSTPFHFHLASLKSMLFAFTDAKDLTIGIADANRHDSDVMGSIGFFLNLLTLRFQRQDSQVFTDAIVEARKTAYAALEHSGLPFDVLLEELSVARSSSYSPFFQAFFDYRQQTSDRETWCNCQFNLEEMHPGRTAYDISLDVADLGSDVHITLRVQKGLYELTAANLLLETYTHFVESLARDASVSLENTPLYSERQLATAVQIGGGPDMVSDWPATLIHRIDQIARENVGKTALMDGLGNSLTYAAMINRIEAIAESLVKSGVGRGSRVLVYQQATADWICSLLAIMRIGGVYVPLDLRNPMERLAAQADHCLPGAVLVDDTTAADAPQLKVPNIIDISNVGPVPSARVRNSAHPDSPAAILYTSGSTGTPKGIMIKHSGIRNEMEGYTKTYKLGAECVLQQSAFTFDFSVDQIFTGLVNGGMLYIVPWSKRGDPISITEVMRDQAITYTKVTPSEYSMWLQYGGDNLRRATSWRFAFGGGEPITKSLLKQFADLGLDQLRLHNSYGPAEISIASHKGFIDYRTESKPQAAGNDGPVPCGFSLPNYATYILDDNLKPLPVGMPGEVVIGGAGVSFGYLSNEELTSRVFVPNPYATPKDLAHGWTHMHRTGDIGHLQANGSLVFRNRVAGDTQVKLRGLRIDLRDVEMNMVSTAGGVLKDAVVTLREGDPEFLVAHVVFSTDHEVKDKGSYLEQLLSRLPIPQYMIPVMAIPLRKLPLTNHSKVDRRALKTLDLPRHVPAGDRDIQDDDAETTETISQLRQVWRQVLPNTEKLGLAIQPSTSFFQVGGNSLLVVRLQSRIRQVFNVAVRLVDLLNANTLSHMTRKIEESPVVDLIDWNKETEPPKVPNFVTDLPAKNYTDPKTVLITGSTGNLAKHLFPLLLADPRISKIHCVAVRDKPRQDNISSDPKVVYHPGDLSLPLLGLGVDEFRGLALKVDIILHLGAVRSFWDNYHMLRPTNVHPTKELVKLAAARRIPIHFISTSGVLPQDAVQAAGPAGSAMDNKPPADGSDGYLATKWASERVLERSAQGPLQVPSFIYRLFPSSAIGASQSEETKQQALAEFVRCIDLGNVMPDTTGWEGRIDLIPAESVAQWLRDSILKSPHPETSDSARPVEPSDEATAAHFSHYESPVTIDVEQLKMHVEHQRGDRGLERLPILKWMGRIKALGFGYILASQDASVVSGQGGAKLTSKR